MHKSTSQVSFDACWYNKHRYHVIQTAVKEQVIELYCTRFLVFVILTTFYFYVAQLTIHGEVL